MIGTKAKGFRHIIRVAKTSKEVGFFFKHDFFHVSYGVALYVSKDECANPYMCNGGDYLMIFNNSVSNVKYNDQYHTGTEIGTRIKMLAEKHPNVWVIPVEKRNFNEESSVFMGKVLVPSDFDKKYEEFCEANKKQMQNAVKYAPKDSCIFRYLFNLSNGSKNFFFWAVGAYFKAQVSLYLIEKILLWNDNYSQLSNKLAKGTITAYTSQKDLFAIVREMAKLRRDKRANDVISMFNTMQKKLLREYKLNDRDYETLSKFGKLSAKKKLNFIKKMSTIEDASEILKQMSFLADVHFEWKKESLLEFLKNNENFNCEVVIDRDNIVLLKVKDYETVKRLAKTTNWCISKDKKYWSEYVEHKPNATQYVLMDFSRKEDDNLSIVGFTSVHDRGITNAHDFQNRNLMQGRRISGASEIKSFVSKFIDCSSIYGVLDKNGIKVSDVVSYEPNHFEWNRESMFKYLRQCISDEDYYIIYDDGDRIALIADNDNIRYFFGDAYIENRGLDAGGVNSQHILFADFTKKANDPEKLIFGVIKHNFSSHESSCARLYNDKYEPLTQSFDSKLEEYGLPYDIICRTDNPVDRFFNSLSSLELASLKDLIKNKAVREEINSNYRSGYIRDSIINVTFGYNSSDYIDLFYDNGFTISNVIGARGAADIASRMINTMHDMVRNNFGMTMKVPTPSEIESFKKGEINAYEESMYIGNFLMLVKMANMEEDGDFFYRLTSAIVARHQVCDLFDLIMTIICHKVDLSSRLEVAKYISAYAFDFGSPRVVNVINSIKNKSRDLKSIIDSRRPRDYKTTEMWVLGDNGNYVVEGVNEEAAAHAPRRR